MRVTVDRKRCSGYATCVITAPTVFELNEAENYAYTLVSWPSDALIPKIREAARLCPTKAIIVTEESER